MNAPHRFDADLMLPGKDSPAQLAQKRLRYRAFWQTDALKFAITALVLLAWLRAAWIVSTLIK